jgi:hypothetical protein
MKRAGSGSVPKCHESGTLGPGKIKSIKKEFYSNLNVRIVCVRHPIGRKHVVNSAQ